ALGAAARPGRGHGVRGPRGAAALTLAILRLLVVICAAVAGAALAVALRVPTAAAALAGAALGAAAVALELAVALGRDPASAARGRPRDGGKLLDTSAIRGGRIADVVTTGYLEDRCWCRASCCASCSAW